MDLDVGEQPQTNSMRLPSTAYTDIKFHKRFRISGMEYTFQVWINNLFDNKNVLSVYRSTGRYDTDNNQSGIIGEVTERQANPEYLGRGRQVIVGLGLQF
jgi:hypothetical protein